MAEDNLVNQKVIAQMLRKLGCEAQLVVDGAQALAAGWSAATTTSC